MLIDNLSNNLINKLVCPVSREAIKLVDNDLVTESGYVYPGGDFRHVNGSTPNQLWRSGQAHYEKYSKRWMTHSVEFYEAVDMETTQVYQQIPLTGDVLDVGGGYGTLVKQAQLAPRQVICIDPLIAQWSNLPDGPYKQHYSVLASLVRIPGYAEDLPFRNGTFDTVHMRSCLDHFANPHRALLEARRVLKDDGRLVIGLALEGAFKLKDSGFYNTVKRRLKSSFVGDVHAYLFDKHMFHPTDESLRMIINSAGFNIVTWMLQPGYSGVVYLSATKK